MSFYTFRQNNSGGAFSLPAINVFVEADSAGEANDIAESHGVYFDDDYEVDCECCGQRWYRATEWDAREEPREPSVGDQWFADTDDVPVSIVILKNKEVTA